MSAYAGIDSAHTGRLDSLKSEHASPATIGSPDGAAHETDPFMLRRRAMLPCTTRWDFISSNGEGVLAKQAAFVGNQDQSASCFQPTPPPAPRLRPSPGTAVVPFLALESEGESDSEDKTPRCPAAPRLGPQEDPPCVATMARLKLPPASDSLDTSEWDDKADLVINGPDEADSEAEGEFRSSVANIWLRMVSASASTACADDLDEVCQSPWPTSIYSDSKGGCTVDHPFGIS